jgi:hypothetical protein
MTNVNEAVVFCVVSVCILIGYIVYMYFEYKMQCFEKIREDAKAEREKELRTAVSRIAGVNEEREITFGEDSTPKNLGVTFGKVDK